jgi:hypothetical protein
MYLHEYVASERQWVYEERISLHASRLQVRLRARLTPKSQPSVHALPYLGLFLPPLVSLLADATRAHAMRHPIEGAHALQVRSVEALQADSYQRPYPTKHPKARMNHPTLCMWWVQREESGYETTTRQQDLQGLSPCSWASTHDVIGWCWISCQHQAMTS